MTELVDTRYFEDLARQAPEDVCKRALCTYDAAEKSYALSVWGREYRVSPGRAAVECRLGHGHRLPAFFDLFLVYYLLKAKEVESAGEWISEKDIVGGATFFRGPHAIPTQLVTDRFVNDTDCLVKRFEQLGGRPLALADVACSFMITPRIPVAVLYWRGDEDFPAEAKILYDKTVTEHLSTDIVFALAVGVCARLGRSGER